jgi:hypothetical protein
VIKFHHTALGVIQDDHRQGFPKGWGHIHERIRVLAEGKRMH